MCRAKRSDASADDADLDLRKIDREYERKAEAAADAAEAELNKLFHEKVAEVAVGSVERARDNAKFLQIAASAIFAVYTGLLALVYSVTDNPLPLRGAWAGVFIGLSIAFATAYLTFLTNGPRMQMTLDPRGGVHRQYSRTAGLIAWISASVNRRTYAIRAAVISLLFGVLFMTAPFVSSAVPVPEVPRPTPPSVPEEVDDAFTGPAFELFESQIEDYRNAVAARSSALDAAEEAARERADQESTLNEWATWLAVLALVVVLLGPDAYARIESRRNADDPQVSSRRVEGGG
ncbi:hypothetical protein [Janibacter alittae]|uniref:Uncharacterized protein n=1 Tax=Janibacter alittae TaxID=3115209 RepID=A0ABZ2MKU0_9MICO